MPYPPTPRSSARSSATTATTPPTSRFSSPSPPDGRRGRVAELLAPRLAAVDGHRLGRGRGSGLPQHHARRGRAGRARRSHRRGRDGVRPRRRAGRPAASTSSSSRPTPPVRCTLATRGGPRSATRSARVLEAAGAEVDPRVLHQRPRPADGPVRGVARGRGARASPSPRTATRATTSRTSRGQVVASDPSLLDCPRGSGIVAFREAGYAAQLQSSRTCSTTSARTSTSGTPSARSTKAVPSSGASTAPGAGPRLRGRRRGVAAHDRLR